MSDNRPIGVFDSGLGGLTVVRELNRLLPGERIIYLGDTARVPYGSRSEETIAQFGLQDALYLAEQDIKLLIVACNTVSSVALGQIQARFTEIPVIGVVEPGARAAVLRTAEKKVGVIGTAATIRTQSYAKAINAIDKDIKVYSKACPLFVPLVEEGIVNHVISRQVAQYYLYELVDHGIDCLILGCTHYPLLIEIISETVTNQIQVLDSALWTAKEAQDMLRALNALNVETTGGFTASSFLVTDLTPNFERSAQLFLGAALPMIKKIKLEDLTCLPVAGTMM